MLIGGRNYGNMRSQTCTGIWYVRELVLRQAELQDA
jgi:hypothetical protein